MNPEETDPPRSGCRTGTARDGRRGCHRRVRGRRSGGRRRGVATVEFALMLPIIFGVVIGSIELCQRMSLKQSAVIAAYEAARAAGRRGVTQEEAKQVALDIMAGRNVRNVRVWTLPSDISTLTTGETFTMVVRVPMRPNTTISYLLPSTGDLRARAHMMRE